MNYNKNHFTRRRFLGLSTAAAAYVMVAPGRKYDDFPSDQKQVKPHSRFGGVQIGAITYSWRSIPGTAEDTLKYCLACGISSIELMGNVPEQYAGIPSAPPRPARDAPEAERTAYMNALSKISESQRNWRTTASMDRFIQFRKMYNDAGVNIHIAKFSPENLSDDEIDYAFRAAKALGAKGVSTEIGDKAAEKLGPLAEKHGMFNILHNHMQPGQPGWTFEKFLDMHPANMLNFDAGHYFGATGLHPNGIIEKLHSRIFSIHMKDKTGPKSTPANANMPWGKGETPIADILLLLKKEKWPINVDIELEYNIPEGSDAVTEVKKCVDYCRDILS